jgi:hypothetical protein
VGASLVDLPVPCEIEITNPIYAPTKYEWDGPEVDLDFEHPGTYKVTVRSVQHLPGEFTVTT